MVQDILGQTLILDGRPHSVVGVMPSGFEFPSSQTEVWVPFGSTYEDAGRGNFFVDVIGRLKENVTLQQAHVDMNAIAANLERLYPEANADSRVNLIPLHEQITGKVRRMLLLLLGAVALVLLIACTNVANLLLARVTARQKEFALRCALGASRSRIVSQLLTESFLLSLTGGLLGLFVAYWIMQMLIVSGSADFPRLSEIEIDGRVLGFTFVVTMLTSLLFGLAPALQASRTNLNETLKAGGYNTTGRSSLLRSSLVITEVALSLVLLIGAGLLMRSFWRVLSVNPGFTTGKILVFDVALPWTIYDRKRAEDFFQQALQRISNLPGVESSGATTKLPLGKDNNSRYFALEGRVSNDPRDYTIADHRLVSWGYFQTLGMRLRKGRLLTEQDSGSTAPAVIVNEAFARAFFPGQDPLGKRFKMGETTDSPFPWMTVVGVVGDVKHSSLEVESKPEFYRPFLHNQDTELKMTFVVRTTQSPEILTAAIRREILALDPAQPISNVSTMERLVDSSLARRRLSLAMLGLLALVALLLASLGIYGVISYTVSQNTREIGIRIALGARAGDVLKLVVGHGLMLTVLGVGIGLGVAFALTRLMASLLFGVTATDPFTFATVVLFLVSIALLACYLPARRATRVNPVVALRHD